MAYISVTTISNGSSADADVVMTNFNGIVSGLSDGTKDLNVSAITMAGNLTISGKCASNFLPSTDAGKTLGSSSFGWESLYLLGTSDGGTIYFDGGTSAYIQYNTTGDRLIFAGSALLEFPGAVETIAASGNAQGDVPITKSFVAITSTSNGRIATLPAAVAGRFVYITNDGGGILKLYPASGDAINALAADASIDVADGSIIQLFAIDDTTWYGVVAS